MSLTPVLTDHSLTSSHSSSTSKSDYLDWTQRPAELNAVSSSAFENLAKKFTSGWGLYNGQSSYNICSADEWILAKKVIQQAPKDQKDFYFLDIGAGNFQWSKGMADFIEEQNDLSKDIKVHIFGIRGEGFFGNRVVETDRCKIYNLGAFKVEELFKEFKEKGFDLEGKIDLAITHWCFRHLADPVGTFVQVYNLLRPKTSYFLLDGFFFLTEKMSMDNVDVNLQMTQLLFDTKAPFLTRYNNLVNSANHFILRRPDESPCRLPMVYVGIKDPGEGWQIGSRCVTQFRIEPQEKEEKFNLPSDYLTMRGDKKMHDWLKKNGVLPRLGATWNALRDADRHLVNPPLHQFILRGELDKIKVCLERGDDIDESDSMGNSALHIAIQQKSFDLFKLILSKGANLELVNGKAHTPLHEACIHDSEGQFIQALVDAGAPIKAKSFYWGSPLCCAIAAKNLKAIEILIKAGAEISAENDDDLDAAAFSSLRERGIIGERQKIAPNKQTANGVLHDVFHWIKEGNCVVLHNNEINGIQYHYPNDSNKNPQLIFVNVYPLSNLLNNGEWPGFLRDAGYECQPCNPEEIKKARSKDITYYRLAD